MTTTTDHPLRVAYIGNFEPDHSTENHVARALRNNGHHVYPHQENVTAVWHQLLLATSGQYDLVLWTRTKWNPPVSRSTQLEVLAHMRDISTPVVGFHLDRWWGLQREGEVLTEPFFGVDLLATADGGHDEQWGAASVKHWWSPPGVSRDEAVLGKSSGQWRMPVAFVGSWQGYHPEWVHRQQLVEWCRARRDTGLMPPSGRPAIRGEELQDLYASVDVVVGDSCLVGDEYTGGEQISRYWSDRIPETLGRGGFLLHPNVDGLEEHYTPGTHLVTWDAGDFDQLDDLVAYFLANPEERRDIAAAGRAHVLEHHTYEVRMRQLLAECTKRGLL